MNNFSSFVYDGLSRNVSIVETTTGAVTSTKMFVWAKDKMRPYAFCEERDGSGTLTKKFFGRGQVNSATKYFYDFDHLGSVREMTDNSGGIQAQYALDPFGRVSKISESVASDFGYAGYYLHARSGLNLTKTRAYSALQGRFINRDSIEENGGLNLFGYALNNPVSLTDPSGTATLSLPSICKLVPWLPGCSPKPRCKNTNSPSNTPTPTKTPTKTPTSSDDDDDEGPDEGNCYSKCTRVCLALHPDLGPGFTRCLNSCFALCK